MGASHLLHVSHDPGIGGEVANPHPGEARDLRKGAGDDDIIEVLQHPRRGFRIERIVRLVDDHERTGRPGAPRQVA